MIDADYGIRIHNYRTDELDYMSYNVFIRLIQV